MTHPPNPASNDEVEPAAAGHAVDALPPCPECEATDVTLEAVVGADPVVRYYRCTGCRHEWGVAEPTERIDDTTGDPDPVPS